MRQHLWAVWFNGHIHTDADQKLAIFRTRRLAEEFVERECMPSNVVITKVRLLDEVQ